MTWRRLGRTFQTLSLSPFRYLEESVWVLLDWKTSSPIWGRRRPPVIVCGGSILITVVKHALSRFRFEALKVKKLVEMWIYWRNLLSRKVIVNHFIPHTISRWTPGQLPCNLCHPISRYIPLIALHQRPGPQSFSLSVPASSSSITTTTTTTTLDQVCRSPGLAPEWPQQRQGSD